MPCEPNQPNRTPCQSCPSPNDFVNIPQGFGLTRIVREALQTNMELTQCLADFCGVGTGTEPEVIDFTQLITNLTVDDQVALCQAIVDAGCDLTSVINLQELIDNSSTAEFENLFNALCATQPTLFAVSYTHLTLPTKRIV